MTTVEITELREQTTHLLKTVYDFSQCVGDKEKSYTIKLLKRIGSKLIEMESPRATERDLHKKDTAIDRSAEIILNF